MTSAPFPPGWPASPWRPNKGEQSMNHFMTNLGRTTLAAAGATALAGVGLAVAESQHPAVEKLIELGYPPPQEGELVDIPPTMPDLEPPDLHPETKKVIRRGYDLFTNTQQ